MTVLDTNFVLRFLVKNDHQMYKIARDTIVENICFIDNEVFVEVVYVLKKVYQIPKSEIRTSLEKFLNLSHISVDNKTLLTKALEIYETKNLDIVDAILCVKSKHSDIRTFDKKLKKCIRNFAVVSF